MAQEIGVPFLGKVPIDPDIVCTADAGQPFMSSFTSSKTAEIFREVIRLLLERRDS